MFSFEKNKKIKYINYLICFIPLACILGNPIININVILICVLGIVLFKGKIANFFRYHTLITIFFIFIILSTGFNTFFYSPDFKFKELASYESFLKSIFLLRYLLFIVILNELIKNKNFNIENFFKITSIIILLFASDIILQYFYGANIFGMIRPTRYHHSGMFGNELVAGGYLLKFCIFAILFHYIIQKNNYKNLISIFIMVIFFSSIFFSGNKMPVILYFFSLSLIFLTIKELRFNILVALFISCIIFIISYQTKKETNMIYYSLYHKVTKTLIFTKSKIFDSENSGIVLEKLFPEAVEHERKGEILTPGEARLEYYTLFNTAIQVWKEKKIIGSGLKGFRNKCYKYDSFNKEEYKCSNHPHNYYFEVLAEFGLIGLILLLLIYIKFFFQYIKYINNSKKNIDDLLKIASLTVLLTLLFPLKTSGSLFTTSESIIIFFLIGLITNGRNLKIKFS
jgi:O-antigen ligase